MKIYWFKAQAPRRVVALAKFLKLDAEMIEVDVAAGGLSQPDYVRLNPNMKAPTLVDGDTVLWESSAIMAYLCIKAGSDLWPAQNPHEQVDVLRWLAWTDCHWSPVVGAYYFEHIIKPMFGMGPPDENLLIEKRPELERWAKILDDHLKGRTYAACDRLTIADFYLSSMASYWRDADMQFGAFPNLVRWLDTLDKIPAWSDPWPDSVRVAA